MVNSSETERNERMDTSSLMEQILSKDNLNQAYLQVVCNKGAVNVAINNKRLASFGLISMLDYYTERCVTC